jgi:hypothetical protein
VAARAAVEEECWVACRSVRAKTLKLALTLQRTGRPRLPLAPNALSWAALQFPVFCTAVRERVATSFCRCGAVRVAVCRVVVVNV